MFVRIKTTPNSPRKSVQIVQSVRKSEKVSQKIVRHVGVAMDNDELEKLLLLAESIRVKLEAENQYLLFPPEELASMNKKIEKKVSQESSDDFQINLKNIVEEARTINGIHDIYGTLFEELGYTSIIKNPARHKSNVEILKHIVMARIANPQSKKSSVQMLERDFGVSLSLDKVYKMMDKLDDKAIDKLNELTYKNTLKLFGGKLNLLLYDCTTIYFESFDEDDLKKNGYSKDCKFNQPQVLLGLLVTTEGLPVGYQVFPGDKYEGHTLIPVLNELKKKYNLERIIFVSDSGLLNNENLLELEKLEEKEFEYIMGARLKNLPKNLQKDILNLDNYKQSNKNDEYSTANFIYQGRKLIVSYSPKRARKDYNERQKSIEKLMKKLKKSENPKEYLSNYGYKKYLKISGSSSIELDMEKIEKDSKWDGLHGVITNAKDFSNKEIISQYKQLWEVENAFRITKHDLKVRPIFHWKDRRVKAHLAISFISYALVKYLEYRVKLQYISLSPENIRQNLIRTQTSILYDSKKQIRYALPSMISDHTKKIYKICNINRKSVPYILEDRGRIQ